MHPVVTTVLFVWVLMIAPQLAAAETKSIDWTGKSDVSKGPYPQSELIKGITWEWETYTNAAPGSDLWPVTWGPDDNLYVAWGDGGGFGGTDSDGRVAMGIGRIEGGPENWRGFNVNGGKNPEHPASFPKKGKTSGLLYLEGTLYALINLQDGRWPDVTHVLEWSKDKGATWMKTGWAFPRGAGCFEPAKFLNFGKNYSGVPTNYEDYVYIYGQRQPESGRNETKLYLQRAPLDKFREGRGFETFQASEIEDKLTSPFEDKNGAAIAGIVYNPGLKRFLLTTYHIGPGQLGVFEGPAPSGPWKTVAYYENWGGMTTEGEGLSCEFPQKWMSTDGKTMWCIFAVYGEGAKKGIGAHDRFNLIRVKLEIAEKSEPSSKKADGH